MLGTLFLPYHTNRFIRKSNIRRFSCTFDEASHLGIVCSYHSLIKENVIDDFVEKLKKSGKKVSLLVFHENSSNTDGLSDHSFSKNDLSFLGFWKKEQVKSFIAKEFDFLLHLDLDYNPFIANIISCSKAHCRIGVFNDRTQPYLELMIKPTDKTLAGLIVETEGLLGRIKNHDE